MRDATDLFDELEDPRVGGRCNHRLIDIVMIALVATMGDTDDWQKVEMFGRLHQGWFKRFLELPGGIPSPDTLERVFARLDPARMHTCFARWINYLDGLINSASEGGGRTIAIDGKTLWVSNKARDAQDRPPLHLVSAWAQQAKRVLGQVSCDQKNNEITAIPELLDLLDLPGATVTIDATPGVGLSEADRTKAA